MTREPSYYGNHHWPLPCQTVQHSATEEVQNQLALRPKSTLDRVKYERPRSVSPQMLRNIPPADGSATPYDFSKGTAMSIQTQMTQDLHQIPMAPQYSTDTRVEDISTPCQFSAESHIESLTSPATIHSSPTDFSELSSGPESAHLSLFFPGPTSQPYAISEDTSLDGHMGYPMAISAETIAQDQTQQSPYDAGSKPMAAMQAQYSDGSLSMTQQPPMGQLVYYDPSVYQTPVEQYYPPAPAWLEKFKPEESWPGPMPSERMTWSQ